MSTKKSKLSSGPVSPIVKAFGDNTDALKDVYSQQDSEVNDFKNKRKASADKENAKSNEKKNKDNKKKYTHRDTKE